MDSKQRMQKQNRNKIALENILYRCRQNMKNDSEWAMKNTDGKCEDYILLIACIKEIKQHKHGGVKDLSLDCKNMWKPCYDALLKIGLIYGFVFNSVHGNVISFKNVS